MVFHVYGSRLITNHESRITNGTVCIVHANSRLVTVSTARQDFEETKVQVILLVTASREASLDGQCGR